MLSCSPPPYGGDGGDCARPFNRALGPNIDGIGFLRALAVLIRGTPCITRGSFIKVGSSFAGTEESKLVIDVSDDLGTSDMLTSCYNGSVITWKLAVRWHRGSRTPYMIRSIRKKACT